MALCTPRKLFLLAATSIAIALPIAFAQAPTTPAKPFAFEFANITLNKSNSKFPWRMRFTADGFSAMNVSLQYLIRDAYGLYEDRRWSGGPAWLDSEKFDIEAKFDVSEFKSPTLDQRRSMLQTLLADRFKLAVQHETKEFPIYDLVIGKNGPQFKESKPEDIHGTLCFHPRSRPGDLAFQGCSMQDLASLLSSFPSLGRTIVNKTGLTGRYDFELRWTPENAPASTNLESSAPSIFTAFQEQLGLTLEPAKGPLDTIVIDHVEMPSEN